MDASAGWDSPATGPRDSARSGGSGLLVLIGWSQKRRRRLARRCCFLRRNFFLFRIKGGPQNLGTIGAQKLGTTVPRNWGPIRFGRGEGDGPRTALGPVDVRKHHLDDLVEGCRGGNGSVGGPDEQDESESARGPTASGGDQDASPPAVQLVACQESGQGVLADAQGGHEFLVAGECVGLLLGGPLEAESEAFEVGIASQLGSVEPVVIDVVLPAAGVDRGLSECGTHGIALPARGRLGDGRGARCAHNERRSLGGTLPALYDFTEAFLCGSR